MISYTLAPFHLSLLSLYLILLSFHLFLVYLMAFCFLENFAYWLLLNLQNRFLQYFQANYISHYSNYCEMSGWCFLYFYILFFVVLVFLELIGFFFFPLKTSSRILFFSYPWMNIHPFTFDLVAIWITFSDSEGRSM